MLIYWSKTWGSRATYDFYVSIVALLNKNPNSFN